VTTALASPELAFPLDRPRRRLPTRLAAFLLAGAAAIALATGCERLIAERRAAEYAALEARLAALAHGRAETLATWVDGLQLLAGRLGGSELVRLFAHESALARDEPGLASALAEQAPYMALLFEETARRSGLVAAGLLARDGSWLAGEGGAALPAEVRRHVARAVEKGGPAVFLIETGPADRKLVLGLPLPAPEAAAGEPSRAALLLVAPAAERLARLLDPQPLDGPGVVTRLEVVQPDGSRLELGPPKPATAPAEPAALRVRAPVRSLPWTVVQEADPRLAAAAVERWAWTLRGLTAGLSLATLALVLLLLTAQAARHERARAAAEEAQARRLEAERRLLDEVTGAVPDAIALEDAEGRLLFANRALAGWLGHGTGELLGRRLDALLEPEAAAALAALDRRARSAGSAVEPELTLSFGGRERILHAVVLSLPDEAGRPGLLRVLRDTSELVLARRTAERRREQTVAALVRAVELADPHLLGHSRALAELAERLAIRLALDPATIATVRLAGELSQIGKIFVPRALLTKEGRHDPEEQRRMREHVEHALRILDGVEFDLPVAEAIAQMHERLDGSGYPRGLTGEAIGPAGRVLAVADVFLARTRPRSYRDALPAGEVLAVLQRNPHRYDPRVVAALEAELAEAGPERA
jgi:PAS domain S-box-containing protein